MQRRNHIKYTVTFFIFLMFQLADYTYPNYVHADNYIVTSLLDSGPGSLRYGVDNSPPEGRYISFSGIGPGTITLLSNLIIDSSNVIIDGLTAKGAVTLSGRGIQIRGDGTFPIEPLLGQNITIRGLRFRNITNYDDEIWVRDNAHDVLIEYCSFDAPQDGMIDVTQGAYNVTIRYNMFLNGLDNVGAGNTLISYGAHHVSFHHNLSYRGKGRQPQLIARKCETYTYCIDAATELRGDVRYNIFWDHRTVTTSEDSKSNFAYNLFKAEDGWPAHYFFVNGDNNPAGGNEHITEAYMIGNACVTECRNLNIGITGANYHNNSKEFPFPLAAEGATWPDKAGIITEWQNTLLYSGLISVFSDDNQEGQARQSVIIPGRSIDINRSMTLSAPLASTPSLDVDVSIFDEPWNQLTVLSDQPKIINVQLISK